MFSIESRRYVGNKFKLSAWIKENILENCTNLESFETSACLHIILE